MMKFEFEPFEPVKTYKVKAEFLENWGDNCTEDYIVTEEEARHLAAEWGMTFDDVLNQLEEI